MTIDEQFCATVPSHLSGSRNRHLSRRLGSLRHWTRQTAGHRYSVSVRTGSGAWKLLVDPLGVHRRVTGSAGFDPREKQWTIILRQVPRSALMAPVRMLHDDTEMEKMGRGLSHTPRGQGHSK